MQSPTVDIIMRMPVDMRADLVLRAVEEGSITNRGYAEYLGGCYGCLYELRVRLSALDAFASPS